jgi:hypothetical protein
MENHIESGVIGLEKGGDHPRVKRMWIMHFTHLSSYNIIPLWGIKRLFFPVFLMGDALGFVPY